MLTGLSIRDVVLIESLDLEFGPGHGVLTRETGAGKSILLDALSLALGIPEEARKAASVLGANYPNAKWYHRAYSLVEKHPPRAVAPAAPAATPHA